MLVFIIILICSLIVYMGLNQHYKWYGFPRIEKNLEDSMSYYFIVKKYFESLTLPNFDSETGQLIKWTFEIREFKEPPFNIYTGEPFKRIWKFRILGILPNKDGNDFFFSLSENKVLKFNESQEIWQAQYWFPISQIESKITK